MSLIFLPSFPTTTGLFVKGVQNNTAGTVSAQYITFGHSFQISQLASGQGLQVDWGSGAVPCQVDTKTRYQDGSSMWAAISCRAPSVSASGLIFGQFASASVVTGSNLTLANQLSGVTATLSITGSTLANWASAHTYVIGQCIKPASGNAGSYVFQMTATTEVTGISGISGNTPPTWPQTKGLPISDNEITWYNVGTNVSNGSSGLVAMVTGSTDLWLQGPLAIQGRAWQGIHDSLRVLVDVTCYLDGTCVFDTMLANDITTVFDTTNIAASAGGTLLYTAAFSFNSTTVFTSSPLQHSLYANWTWQFGSLPHFMGTSQDIGLQVIHNPNDFIDAQAIQAYATTLGIDSSQLSNNTKFITASGFAQPLVNPNPASGGTLVQYGMGGTGGRPDVWVNDVFTCWAFVSQQYQFQQLAYECGKVGGSIVWHMFNAASGRPWIPDDSPALFSFDANPNDLAFPFDPINLTGLALPSYRALDPNWQLDAAHFPELVYISFIQSARRYFMDELNYVTAWSGTASSTFYARWFNAVNCLRGQQMRGMAWSLRNLSMSLYATPDGDGFKTYCRRVIDYNMAWILQQLQRYIQIQGSEMNSWFPNWIYGAVISNFEPYYLYTSLAWMAIQGHAGARAAFAYFGSWPVKLLNNGTNNPPTGFPPAQGINYDFLGWQVYSGAVSTDNTPYTWGSSFLPIQTWDAMEQLVQGTPSEFSSNILSAAVSGSWVSWGAGIAGGNYGQLMWIGYNEGITVGVPGASAALNILTTTTGYVYNSSFTATGNVPFIDDASWQTSNSQWRIEARTTNSSLPMIANALPGVQGYGQGSFGGMSAVLPSTGSGSGSGSASGSVNISNLIFYQAADMVSGGGMTVGGAINLSGRVEFSELASPAKMAWVSSSSSDTAVTGSSVCRDGTGALGSESVVLNGQTPVSGSNTWSRLLSASLAGSPTGDIGWLSPVVLTGTAQGGAAASGSTAPYITLASGQGASASPQQVIRITNNTPTGIQFQLARILGIVGDTAYVNNNWSTVPTSATTYAIHNGALMERSPHSISSVTRPFVNLPGPGTFYSKIFIENTTVSGTLTNVGYALESLSSPHPGITASFGLASGLGDSQTSTNWATAPAGITFLTGALPVLSGQAANSGSLGPGNNLGVWLRSNIAVTGSQPYDGFATMFVSGNTT